MVYRYAYERAVREGYLVDYDVVSLRSNVRMNGVFLEQGEQVEQVDPETGAKQLDLLEDERRSIRPRSSARSPLPTRTAGSWKRSSGTPRPSRRTGAFPRP